MSDELGAAAHTPIFLLTDFGLRDTYVGQLKAVLLARAPGCLPVDLTHDVPPQDVAAGARALADCLPYLPRPATVLVVVDPGVGTARRPMVVDAGGICAIGPDNGVLEPVLARDGARAFTLDPARVGADALSATFHGRDLFAPAAAAVARGVDPGSLGARIADPVRRAPAPPPAPIDDGWRATIVARDHFGNLITDVTASRLAPHGARWRLRLDDGTDVPRAATYGDAGEGALIGLIGSNGRLELARNGGSAAACTGLDVGDGFDVLVGGPKGER